MSQKDTPDIFGFNDETMDPREEVAAPSAEISVAACVDLVEGKWDGLSGEMRSVLLTRLRIAAMVLCAGFGVFFAWTIFEAALGATTHWELVIHLAVVTAVLGLCGWMLHRSCPVHSRALPVHEAIVFGFPAIFFIHVQVVQTLTNAVRGLPLQSPAAAWLLLVFTYAIFIPNTWRRAAAVLFPLAAIPVLTLFALWLFDRDVALSMNTDPEPAIELVLVMLVALGASVTGVHTIGKLRREAFTARQLGQYRLLRQLGAGGMGEVFLAEHRLLKRPCAIKVIRPEKAGDERVLKRFEREVRATATLSHWNSVAVYDYGRTRDGTFYYVMEYLPGRNLNDLVERYGPMPAARVVYLLLQACDALREAHARQIVHRDIKPANLFLAERGGVRDVVKVLDFGLAKPLGAPAAPGLTQEGTIAGSPFFMSPEQAMGEPHLDARSDIYSLGTVAYFLLTGQPPFDERTPMKVLFAQVNQPPSPPSERQGDVPADLEQVVLRCLAKRPEDRYQNTEELARALRSCESFGEWQREDADRWWEEHREELVAEPVAAGV